MQQLCPSGALAFSDRLGWARESLTQIALASAEQKR
jgi:hypothetical protein